MLSVQNFLGCNKENFPNQPKRVTWSKKREKSNMIWLRKNYSSILLKMIIETLKMKQVLSLKILKTYIGGESGIRTHERVSFTRFPSVRLQPLGHLSKII